MANAGSAAFNPNDSHYKACCCHAKTFTIVVGILEIFAICFVLVAEDPHRNPIGGKSEISKIRLQSLSIDHQKLQKRLLVPLEHHETEYEPLQQSFEFHIRNKIHLYWNFGKNLSGIP
ncbi:unnamed protein product [Haemonchus placei]|uniref:Uncharacterized protein n=1 Tax=Haemonchus placei TaxID=6290 RepID=A0A0N4WYH3_HAEPC|nr:unnamed protein product [Haemonchus placei]